MLTNRDSGYRQVRVTCTCGMRIFERTSHDYAEWSFVDNAVYAALHEAVQVAHRPPEHRMRVEITTEQETEAETQDAEDSA